jgi:DegV family protein with EDD domain
MSKVAIVTDSTVTLPDEYVKKYDIHVAPQILVWGEETYQDGIDIQPHEFYNILKTARQMPTTSQVPVVLLKDLYSQLLDSGHEVLSIFISSQLSGTMQSAIQAKAMFPAAPIELIDSQTTSMAMGFHVLAAARAAEEGASLAECKAIAEKARENGSVFFVVATLEFLHRGGRIGGATRFLGTALDLKPILEIQHGHVEPIERVRSKRKAIDRLLELVETRVNGRQPVHLSVLHANAPEEANDLLERASQRMKAVESIMTEVSPVVGTHSGPGTVGLAYLAGM